MLVRRRYKAVQSEPPVLEIAESVSVSPSEVIELKNYDLEYGSFLLTYETKDDYEAGTNNHQLLNVNGLVTVSNCRWGASDYGMSIYLGALNVAKLTNGAFGDYAKTFTKTEVNGTALSVYSKQKAADEYKLNATKTVETAPSFTATGKTVIGAAKKQTLDSGYTGKFNFYSLQITDLSSGELIADYVPATFGKKSGAYDKVDGIFYEMKTAE
jgi:hypothetical protein